MEGLMFKTQGSNQLLAKQWTPASQPKPAHQANAKKEQNAADAFVLTVKAENKKSGFFTGIFNTVREEASKEFGKAAVAAAAVAGGALLFKSIDRKALGDTFFNLSQKLEHRQKMSDKLWELKWIPVGVAVTDLSKQAISSVGSVPGRAVNMMRGGSFFLKDAVGVTKPVVTVPSVAAAPVVHAAVS